MHGRGAGQWPRQRVRALQEQPSPRLLRRDASGAPIAGTGVRNFGSWLDDASVMEVGSGFVSIGFGVFRTPVYREVDLPTIDSGVAIHRRVQLGMSVPYYRGTVDGYAGRTGVRRRLPEREGSVAGALVRSRRLRDHPHDRSAECGAAGRQQPVQLGAARERRIAARRLALLRHRRLLLTRRHVRQRRSGNRGVRSHVRSAGRSASRTRSSTTI